MSLPFSPCLPPHALFSLAYLSFLLEAIPSLHVFTESCCPSLHSWGHNKRRECVKNSFFIPVCSYSCLFSSHGLSVLGAKSKRFLQQCKFSIPVPLHCAKPFCITLEAFRDFLPPVPTVRTRFLMSEFLICLLENSY